MKRIVTGNPIARGVSFCKNQEVVFMLRSIALIVCTLLGAVSLSKTFGRAQTTPGDPPAPLADHHQHLSSPAVVSLMSSTSPLSQAVHMSAGDLIPHLDAAGIRRAAVHPWPTSSASHRGTSRMSTRK